MKAITFLQTQIKRPIVAGSGFLLLGLLLGWPLWSSAQDKKDPSPAHTAHPQPTDKTADSNKELLEQIKQLRATVAQLEATVNKIAPHTGAGAANTSMPKMGNTGGKMGMDEMMMGGMGSKKPGGQGMGMMDMDAMMGGMAGGKKGMSGMSDMGMMDQEMMGMMNMMGMGSMGGADPKMKSMGKMKMIAALPGFPGASHIYHIGATGFFLDHPEHLTLTTEQQTKLNRTRQKALTEKATADRKIEEAEQQLWELTSAEEPDATKIQTQIQAIEKLRGEQRLAFIRAVGDAAKVLTDEQRKVLLGAAPPTDKPAGHVHPKTP